MSLPVLLRIGEKLRLWRSASRVALARNSGTRIDRDVLVGYDCECSLGSSAPRRGQIQIGEGCELVCNVILHPYGGSIRLAPHIFLGPGVVIYGHGGVEIGDACLIAMHCRILSSNHTVAPFGTDIRSLPDVLLPTKIGRDVWLGAGVTVLGGVTIGDGCIVGAGAVVTKDLPPGSISHGTPATVQGWREGAPH